MNRLLILLPLLLLALPGQAVAADLPVPYGAQLAMTESYAYWIAEKPSGCKKCDELRRTSLADGKTSMILRVRDGILRGVRANAQTAAVTVTRTGRAYRSSVVAFNDAGQRRVIADEKYTSRSRRRCGAIVAGGAVSQDNEVSWQRLTASTTRGTCSGAASKVRIAYFAGDISGASRQLTRATKPEYFVDVGWTSAELLDQGRLAGFNGTQLLVDKQHRGLYLHQLATGIKIRLHPNEDYLASSGRLSTTGAVSAEFWTLDEVGGMLLFTNPARNNFVDISLTEEETDDFNLARFCGGNLVQVVPGGKKITIVRRDQSGVELSRQVLPTKRFVYRVNFECNSTEGLLRYGLLTDSGNVINPVSRTMPIP